MPPRRNHRLQVCEYVHEIRHSAILQVHQQLAYLEVPSTTEQEKRERERERESSCLPSSQGAMIDE